MSREEYTNMDVEDYFNYMGMLAAEVCVEKMPFILHADPTAARLA